MKCCEEVVQPDSQTVFLPAKWHRGVLMIPVTSREVGVVCGGEEENDEMVPRYAERCLVKHALRWDDF